MGNPIQEEIALKLSESTKDGTVIICGGAIFEFISETKSRAPKFIRDLNLEWLFRLSLEPKRLASRYTLGAMKFALTVLWNFKALQRPN